MFNDKNEVEILETIQP